MNAHVASVKTYIAVFLALLVLTVVTVLVSYVDLGNWSIVVALLIAVVKASLVAMIFMEVRHATPLTRLVVVAGLAWLAILLVLMFADYSTRGWQSTGSPW